MSEEIALCYSKGNTFPVDRNDKQALANFLKDNSHIKSALIAMAVITMRVIGKCHFSYR